MRGHFGGGKSCVKLIFSIFWGSSEERNSFFCVFRFWRQLPKVMASYPIEPVQKRVQRHT